MTVENFVGLIVFVYGVGKLILSIIKALPPKYDNLFSFVKHDRTTAGYVLDLILFIFGVYSILHGLRLMEHLHPSHAEILNNVHVTVAIYTGIGIFMLVFYSLVLYSNVPISKEDNERTTYEMLGLGGGFTFLLSVCVLLAWHIYYDNVPVSFVRKSHSIIFLVALAILLTYINGMFVHKYLTKKHDNNANVDMKAIAVDIAMMPLASIS